MLMEGGYKVGLFTSPHLWQFHERFQVNGQPMADEALGRLGERVLLLAREMEDSPSEFEMMTAVGMLYFQECGCDIVVLEVGLGGRLDSTNVIPAPEVAVITNIGLEHTQELGNTRALIAAEKSGIIKPGCSVVLYQQDREVTDVVEQACLQAQAPLTVTALDTLEVLSSTRDGQLIRYRGEGPFHLGLLGSYQASNAATALEIVWALQKRGWNIPRQAMEDGLRKAVWPARMELARRDPDVILDGGHNPQCMQAICQSLEQLYPGKKVWFLIGVLADKDYPAMFSQLLGVARGFVTITPDSPRAMTAEDLAQYLRSLGAQATPCASTAQGIDTVLSLAGTDDVVCICGSLYMIGEVRHLLGLC